MSAGGDSELHGSSSERDPEDASGEDSRPKKFASAEYSKYLGHQGQLSEFPLRYGISIVFVVLVASLIVVSPRFRRPENLWNILQQNSIIGVVSCGMLLMMIVGGFNSLDSAETKIRKSKILYRRPSASLLCITV
jgi:hypothetical protein